MSTQAIEEKSSIHVRNIGGIEDTAIEFQPGVTALTGRNATNRTSLLQAIMAACGSKNVSLKGDADEGHAELTVDDTTYTRTITRKNGDFVTDGDPYLEDPTGADLFAFLLESNEARRAVAQGTDLRELIMQPVDTDAIQTDIDRLKTEQQQLQEELDQLDQLEDQLPQLEQQRTQLKTRIADTKEELKTKQKELDAADADVDETQEDKAELDTKLDELQTTRSELETVQYDLETEREAKTSLPEEIADLEDQLEALPEAPDQELEEIATEIERLRDRKRKAESELNQLQSLIQFNEEMLEGTGENVLAELHEKDADETGSVTDQLLADDTSVCWTCGTEVETHQIETTLDRLRDLRKEKLNDVNTIESELGDLEQRRTDFQDDQHQREQLRRELDGLKEDLQHAEVHIKDLETRRDELTDQIDALEADIEELEDDTYSDILDLHKEVNQVEFELDKLERERDDFDEEIASTEQRLEQREDLDEQHTELQADLEDLRTRIERIEDQAIDAFNEHMDTILDILNYENLERIWLERKQQDVREGRRKVTKNIFELHVVRTTQAGTAYEDTIDHLSESEREVTGLVFALAGYLAHDIHETVPFMLLDSLEAVDADRLATLIDHFKQYAEYLVVALLPEDAAALDDEYQRVTEI